MIRPCEQREKRGRIVARRGDLRLTPRERVALIPLRTYHHARLPDRCVAPPPKQLWMIRAQLQNGGE
jgi:hypothetical protein